MAGLPPQIRNLIGGLGGGPGGDGDMPLADTSEQVIISSLALIKMLRHGRAGVPMEVMGLMLGEFIDDYTIKVVDVFSMPQSGNTVSVEAVDPVYQAEMLDMLKRTGRPEMVVGWYHSHPGFGCWFSGTDINTQQSFEQLNSRAVGVVVDPIQSVKGVAVIDCFRLINPHLLMLSQEPRQTTSNVGHLTKPAITALIHGLNKHYYSIVISYRKSELEQRMLLGLMQPRWMQALSVKPAHEFQEEQTQSISTISDLINKYKQEVTEEFNTTADKFLLNRVGKLNAKRRLESAVDKLLSDQILQSLTATISTVVL